MSKIHVNVSVVVPTKDHPTRTVSAACVFEVDDESDLDAVTNAVLASTTGLALDLGADEPEPVMASLASTPA